MTSAKIYTTKDGFKGSIAQIAKHYNINYISLLNKINNSMTIDEAIEYCTDHKRKTYTTKDGFVGSLRKIAKNYNIRYITLSECLKKGMTIDEAIKYKPFKIYTTSDGFEGTIPQIAKHYNVKCDNLRYRLNKGMNIDDAIKDSTNIKRCYTTYTTKDGFTGNIKEIAEHYKINRSSLGKYLRNNIHIDEAIEYCKIKQLKIYTTKDGFTGNIREIAEFYNINKNTISNRIYIQDMNVDEAMTVPLRRVKVKNLKYKGETSDLRYFCKKYNKDFVEVYNKLKHLKTLEYALESTNKPYESLNEE